MSIVFVIQIIRQVSASTVLYYSIKESFLTIFNFSMVQIKWFILYYEMFIYNI